MNAINLTDDLRSVYQQLRARAQDDARDKLRQKAAVVAKRRELRRKMVTTLRSALGDDATLEPDGNWAFFVAVYGCTTVAWFEVDADARLKLKTTETDPWFKKDANGLKRWPVCYGDNVDWVCRQILEAVAADIVRDDALF